MESPQPVTSPGGIPPDPESGTEFMWVLIILSGNSILAVPTFALTAANAGAGYVVITWNAVPGAIYRIQRAPTVSGPWTDATGDISANLEAMAILIQAPLSYFWRGVRWY